MNTLFVGITRLYNVNVKINYVCPSVFSVPAQSVSYLLVRGWNASWDTFQLSATKTKTKPKKTELILPKYVKKVLKSYQTYTYSKYFKFQFQVSKPSNCCWVWFSCISNNLILWSSNKPMESDADIVWHLLSNQLWSEFKYQIII